MKRKKPVGPDGQPKRTPRTRRMTDEQIIDFLESCARWWRFKDCRVNAEMTQEAAFRLSLR